MIRAATTVVTLALALAAPAAAQVELDRQRAAPPKGEVEIENAFGSVVVQVWDRAEVQVRGTLAAGVEDFDFDADKDGTSIDVDVPDAWIHATGEDPAFRSSLVVTVPVGSRLSIRTINASVAVEGVTGSVDVETVNGTVRVSAPAPEIEIETMTGNVEAHGRATAMQIETISGAITATGVSGEARLETVSGKIDVAGAGVAELRVKSTTGPVTFRGGVGRRGGVQIETFSSPVRLVLPRATRATFKLESFAGEIQSEFCAGTPVTREPFEPFHRLRCSTGLDDYEIEVRTHDADITVAAEGGAETGAR